MHTSSGPANSDSSRVVKMASAFRSPSKAPNPAAGTITIVVQAVGKTTTLLNFLEAGDSILDVVGPLGHPSEIRNYGTAVIVAGSVGTAMALPTARALKDADNHVIFIEGARNRNMVIFEDEVRLASNEAYILTDDGSYQEQGLVTQKLSALLATGRKLDMVLAVGPVPMMRAVAQITVPLGIKTVVSLNSIMVDGTGMCGGCRVLLGNTQQVCLCGRARVRRCRKSTSMSLCSATRSTRQEQRSAKRMKLHKHAEWLNAIPPYLASKEKAAAQLRARRLWKRRMRGKMPDLCHCSPFVNSVPYEGTHEAAPHSHALSSSAHAALPALRRGQSRAPQSRDAVAEATRCIACAKPGCPD